MSRDNLTYTIPKKAYFLFVINLIKENLPHWEEFENLWNLVFIIFIEDRGIECDVERMTAVCLHKYCQFAFKWHSCIFRIQLSLQIEINESAYEIS